jgi:ABC-type nitrate/sulfonate/bicarbonate transport system substrate-binding protein
MDKIGSWVRLALLGYWFVIPAPAIALETINVVLTSKALQYVFLPIAQDRGYMKEEGIDLKIVYMQNAPGLQALTAGNVQFSGSGSSALVAISKGGAPLKTILAVNDQVLQWVVVRPNINSIKDLKGGKIATTGVASIATFMFRNILTKYGMDGSKDVVFVDPGPVNRLPALLSGTVDGAILSPEERYAAVDQGMKELMFIGKEVKNSWGTFATSDRFIKEQPKLMAGFARASLKALRLVRQDREGTIAATAKFTELEKPLATRMYDDLVKTFTTGGYVDEETQRNDLAIVKLVAEVNEVVPIQKAYDFSFVRQAELQLNKAGWKP